ncbi:MAG: FimV/HubP family polar landmark protein [Woeseiaceae bacterium]
MSRRLSRISLALVTLLCSNVWALGLGEIKLDSALNEPLRAEIELLSATPEELAGLKVAMAAAETFDRYGLDRPVFLQGIQFQIRPSGRADGNIIEVRSVVPITEPFVTFLVEASWSRGRLLREYTILLDPPTFTPPTASQSTPAITAPTRSDPADSGRIQRSAPSSAAQSPDPEPVRTSPPRVSPTTTPTSQPDPVVDSRPYDAGSAGDYQVERSETLWGITSRVRPDGRLTMNQTMLAIFEANPEAFGGNINILRAGAALRIPSADEIYQIGRGDALSEVERQHAAWDSGYTPLPTTTVDPAVDPAVDDSVSQNDLTLVPPDDDFLDDPVVDDAFDDPMVDEPLDREQEIEQRIIELENAEVPVQQSLIEIRDNELAALREELANIRGEVYDPGLEDPDAFDEPIADDSDEPFVDDAVDDAADDAADDVAADQEPTARPTRRSEPTLVEKALDILTSWWMAIVGVLVVVGGLLFWFMRRGGDDDDEGPEAWRSLDDDDLTPSDLAATESMRAPSVDESIMVVEQESGIRDMDETVDAPGPEFSSEPLPDAASDEEQAATGDTGQFDSLEDTFSSETAINLDQSDPIAEADFHMAYGLYDQAADLINGALGIEPEREDLLAKLCEIYFVWGNRDAFIDSAGRLKTLVGDGENPEWDKIVIMGQQIAADDEMFAGAGVAGATKAVDLSFESDMEGTGALDMEFGADSEDASDIVDLGGDDETVSAADDAEGLDFDFDDTVEAVPDIAAEPGADRDPTDFDVTAEMPTAESTVETPTIEQQFDGLSGTAELPSLEDTLGGIPDSGGQSADATAEINLDDLGLDLDGLAETEVASLDDLDATGEMAGLEDLTEVTGKNPEVDPNATGIQTALSADDTGINESLLDATGATQVLPDDFAVETLSGIESELSDDEATMLAPGYGDDNAENSLADDQETMLASLDDDDDSADFDFAKTEALPPEAFTGNSNLDETGELPAIASTNVDLDLDDLTAALEVSEIGDTIEQLRDDATVEQPRPDMTDADDDVAATMALEPSEMSDDLHDARTMTEVGTKLDLARAYVDMGDPAGARSILEEVLDEGDEAQRQQAQQLLDSLPS